MPTKHCCWGRCNSDSRYKDRERMNGVSFIPFPKPRSNPEKCREWARACGRKNFGPEKVNQGTYICTKHFMGGNGPTIEHPNPIPATFQLKTELQRFKRKEQRPAPKERSCVDPPMPKHQKLGDSTVHIQSELDHQEHPQVNPSVSSAVMGKPVNGHIHPDYVPHLNLYKVNANLLTTSSKPKGNSQHGSDKRRLKNGDVNKSGKRSNRKVLATSDVTATSASDALICETTAEPHSAAPDTDPDTEITCLFHGCSSDKAKHPTLLFYKIPATGRRRQLWLKAINWPRRYCGAKIERVKNIQVDSQAVCCLHFITGQPSNDYTHPDFIPSVYPQIVTRSIKRQPPLHRDCEASSDREREAKRLWWYHVMASMVRTALRQADKATEEHPPTDTSHTHDSTGDPKSPTQLDHTYSIATRFTQCHPKDIACLRRHLKCASTDTHDPDARLMAWLLNSDIPTITQECLEAILSFDHSRRQSLEPNYPLSIIPYMSMNMEAVHTHEQLASVICEMLCTYLTSNPSAQFPNREYCVTIEHIRTELGEPGMLLQRHAQEGLPECNVSPVIKTEPQCDDDDDHHDHYHDDDHGDHHHDNDNDHDEEDADLSHFVIKEEVMDEDDCEQWRSSCGGDLSNMEVKQEVIDDYENSDLSRSNSEVCQWELKDGRLVLKYS